MNLVAFDFRGLLEPVTFPAQLTWIAGVAVLIAEQEHATLLAQWHADALAAGKLVGRREYIAELRAKGLYVPPDEVA